MVRINELKELRPAAWTALLAQNPETQNTKVTAVEQEQVTNGRNLRRYLLSLAGYSEPTTLIGKQTNETEARFYQLIAPELPFLAPRCWYSHVSGEQSWIVIDEVFDDRPPEKWTASDVEAIIDNIAALHATFWEQEELLGDDDWPRLLDKPVPAGRLEGDQPGEHGRTSNDLQPGRTATRTGEWKGERPSLISDHAIRSAGSLAPELVKAAAGLEKLMSLGGWPGVFEEQQLLAAADLLDDPMPVLHPLRELPSTFLHGDLSTDKWYLTLFDYCRLLDWQTATIGPGAYDLVTFVEQFELLGSSAGGWRRREKWPVQEETMEDSYILALGSKLGSGFDATATRQAIPAARCLYVMTRWMPRLATWLEHAPGDRQTWPGLNALDDDQLAAAGFGQIAGLRPYLSGVFARFLRAYRAL